MSYPKEALWHAVSLYVEDLTLEDLQEIVAEDLYQYFLKSASEEELREFISEVVYT